MKNEKVVFPSRPRKSSKKFDHSVAMLNKNIKEKEKKTPTKIFP